MGTSAIGELIDEELANLADRGYLLEGVYNLEVDTYTVFLQMPVGDLAGADFSLRMAIAQMQYAGCQVADLGNMSEYIKLLALHRKAIEVKNLDAGPMWGYILDEGIDHTRLRQELLREGFWIDSASVDPAEDTVYVDCEIREVSLELVCHVDEVTAKFCEYVLRFTDAADSRRIADLLQLESGLLYCYAEAGFSQNRLLAEKWQLLADELYESLDMAKK